MGARAAIARRPAVADNLGHNVSQGGNRPDTAGYEVTQRNRGIEVAARDVTESDHACGHRQADGQRGRGSALLGGENLDAHCHEDQEHCPQCLSPEPRNQSRRVLGGSLHGRGHG